MNKSTRCRRGGLLMAAAALSLMIMLTPSPASAFTTRVLAGRPGAVGVPVTLADYEFATDSRLVMPNRWVWRSPRTSARQLVTVTYRVWRYDWIFGRWILESRTTQPTASIAAGASRTVLPGAVMAVRGQSVYGDDFVVSWRTPSGELLGSRVVDQSSTSDYRCVTAGPPRCDVLQTPNGGGVFLSG